MSKPKTSSPERDALRAAAFAADAATDSKVVEFRGQRFEIRAPSLALQERIAKMESGARQSVATVLECTFVPGSGEKVFEAADQEALLNLPVTPGGLFATLGKAITALVAVTPEGVEKNSESAPTES